MSLDFSKFQQVVEFYEKYHIPFPVTDYDNNKFKLEKDYPEIWKLFWEQQKKKYPYNDEWNRSNLCGGSGKIEFNKWLYDYCFKDGLK